MDERAREALDTLKSWISEAKNIAFFGGAGVSTESGIPDFRSEDGLYRQKYAYPPETILSHSFFLREPEAFFTFYRDKMLCLSAKPNAAHIKLAELEKRGKVRAVITQNIDGLHQAAGSQNVLELHGSVHRNHCMKCGAAYSLDDILALPNVPRCRACGGVIKPDVVLYEEPLDNGVVEDTVRALDAADLLIVGGTSLSVYPAAGLLGAFHGKRVALINRAPTARDDIANLIIRTPIGETFAAL